MPFSQSYDSIKAILLGATKKLSDEFEKFMDGAITLPIDGLSMVALFDDYFGSSAPFEKREEKKHEFPDAVIIMSIERYLKENDHAVMHVVTDDNGWHKAFNIRTGFYLQDIKALLTEISKAEEAELYQQIAQHMGDRLGGLQSFVWDWLYEQEWPLLVDNIEMCIECDEIDDMHIDTIELVPNSIEYINKEDSYAVVGFSGISKIRLDFSYIDHTDEVYDREDHVWLNTVYGEGHIQIEVPLGGSVTVSISDDGDLDFEPPSFDQMQLSDVEISEYELTPHRTDDDPYFDTCSDCGRPIGIHNDGGNGFCVECAPRH